MSEELQNSIALLREARLGEAWLEAELGTIEFHKETFAKVAVPASVFHAMWQHSSFHEVALAVIMRFCLAFDREPSGAREIALLRKLLRKYCRVLAHHRFYCAVGIEERAGRLAELLLWRSKSVVSMYKDYELCEILAQDEPVAPEELAARMEAQIIEEHRRSWR